MARDRSWLGRPITRGMLALSMSLFACMAPARATSTVSDGGTGGALPGLPASQASAPQTATSSIAAAYGGLPLSFEQNRGQADASVSYIAHGRGYTLALTGSGVEVTLAPAEAGAAPGSSTPAADATAASTTQEVPNILPPVSQATATVPAGATATDTATIDAPTSAASATLPVQQIAAASQPVSDTTALSGTATASTIALTAVVPYTSTSTVAVPPPATNTVVLPPPATSTAIASATAVSTATATATPAATAVPPTTLTLQLVGADPQAPLVAQDPLPGTANYFIGSDPSRWLTNIPTFGVTA